MCYSEESISNWKELIDYYNENFKGRNWAFRGQGNSKYLLSTSLERILKDYKIPLKNAVKKEHGILRRFKRQYHHYRTHIPKDDDYIQWYSIMQHFGCPTRLLDFTYSFYIALYFAIEKVSFYSYSDNEVKKYVDCSIWAINTVEIYKRYKENANNGIKVLIEEDKNLKKIDTIVKILENEMDHILFVNPLKLNEKLSIQQGVFCIPLNIKKSFMDNLSNTVKDKNDKKEIIKVNIKIDDKFIKTAYNELNHMNINRFSLFPGLEGFSNYLRMLVPLDESYMALD